MLKCLEWDLGAVCLERAFSPLTRSWSILHMYSSSTLHNEGIWISERGESKLIIEHYIYMSWPSKYSGTQMPAFFWDIRH